MSGSFEKMDVPPTLVSFATAVGPTSRVTSPEFKAVGSRVVLLQPKYTDALLPETESLKEVYAQVQKLIGEGKAKAVSAPGYGCLAESLFKMCVGNRIGLALENVEAEELFRPAYGSFVLEVAEDVTVGRTIGHTTEVYTLSLNGDALDLADLQEIWEARLEPVMPYRAKGEAVAPISHNEPEARLRHAPITIAKPRVIIPVFPGTNCEYDTAQAFEKAGAEAQVLVINNLTPAAVAESCEALVKAIKNSQIVMLPGGFSGGDEPDGSAKFITAFFRAPAVTEAVHELLKQRDGLMLGICNGFQALVKLGLVPYGEIRDMDANCPTLTFNTLGRHQSKLVHTRVASNKSPWLCSCEPGDEYLVAISHGEGRFVAPQNVLDQLVANGQVATQYTDLSGQPTMDLSYNPNGSLLAIEGITSPDGRVLGKMGHTERRGHDLYKNVPGDTGMPLFENGVKYFTR